MPNSPAESARPRISSDARAASAGFMEPPRPAGSGELEGVVAAYLISTANSEEIVADVQKPHRRACGTTSARRKLWEDLHKDSQERVRKADKATWQKGRRREAPGEGESIHKPKMGC